MARRRALLVLAILAGCAALAAANDAVFLHWEDVVKAGAKLEDAVPCGQVVSDKDSTRNYVARIFFADDILPASATRARGAETYAHQDKLKSSAYEVLVGDAEFYSWEPAAMGDVPANAVQTGVTSEGQPLFTCRVYKSNLRGYFCGLLEPKSLRCDSLNDKHASYEVLVEKRVKC